MTLLTLILLEGSKDIQTMVVDGGDGGVLSSLQRFWLREILSGIPLGQLQEQSAQEAIQGVLQSTGMLLLVASALLLVVLLLRFAAQLDALPKTPSTPSPNEADPLGMASGVSISLEPQPYQSVSVQWRIPASVVRTCSNHHHNLLVIRLLDVTDVDLAHQQPHETYDYPCEWNDGDVPQVMGISVPEGDRDYIVELGYRTATEQWYPLARSSHARVQKG